MNKYTHPHDSIEYRNTMKQELVGVLNDVWKTPSIILGTTRTVRIYTAIMNITGGRSTYSEERENRVWLYNTISSFVENKREEIETDNCKDQNPVDVLNLCATTTQLQEMRVKRISRLLYKAELCWAHGNGYGYVWKGSSHPVWDLFDREWNILIPRLREQVERIAWQIYIGQHAEWKPGGEEWRNIEKFYGGLGQRMTMTRLKVPALLDPVSCLRKVYIVTRPVDASERYPWQQRRKETEQCNGGTAGIMQVASRYIPIPCQHWALVVEKYNVAAIWELGVAEGRIKIEQKLEYYPELSHRILVGYTAMSNDEISASAEDARKSMGDMYSFNTFNCQLFCYTLFQFIRVSHTVSDAFSDLSPLPDDRVVPVVNRRLELIPMAICIDFSKVENSQLMPMLFGTLYTRALILATTSLLIYTCINLGIVFLLLEAGVVVGWLPFAQRHTNLYPWSAKRDPDRRRLHYLYEVYNTRKEKSRLKCAIQGVGSQQEPFAQSSRVLQIDDQDEGMNDGIAQRNTNLYSWSIRRDLNQRRLRHLLDAGNARKEKASSEYVPQGVILQKMLFGQSSRIVEIDDQDEGMNSGLDQVEVKSM